MFTYNFLDGISPDASPLTLQYSQRPNGELSNQLKLVKGALSSSLSDDLGEGLKSTFRDRSRSPARGSRDQKVELLPVQGSTSPKLDMLSSWYGDNHVRRPWQGSPKKKKTVPYEQTLALDETRKVCTLIAALQFSSTAIDSKRLTALSL